MSVIDLSPFNAILTRLEGVAERLERGAASAPSQGATANGSGAAPAAAAPAADDCAIAVAFDAFIQEKLPPLTAAAKDVGNQDVIEATDFFADGMGLLRELLAATGVCAKPQDTAWQKILGAVMELGTKAQKACDNRSECFQNRKSAAEALNVITLVTSLSPPAHVQNVLESMDFYATKVMQKKNEKETVWIKALKTAVKDLKDWCGENCKLGVMWNPRGKVAADYFAENPLGSGGKASAASEPKGKGKGKGPAMPKGGLAAPPPELLAKMKPEAGSAAPAAAGMSAVFAGIDGFNTGMLNKVTNDMKTKNQPKDGSRPAPIVPKAAAAAPAFVGGRGKKGPKGAPLKELQKDTIWVIENYDGDTSLELENVTISNSVLIVNCRNSVVHIKNKVKCINIDNCEKVTVICHDVLSVVEMVNSDRIQVQTMGKALAFCIDKCDGVNVFLSKESMEAEFVTSKSSEMNVTIPDVDGEPGDIIEMPIPEQFITRVVGRKLKSEVSHIYST
mmetsp:Transcript_98617/g.178072  ORF Transcript_98617/g.178072 Transcript_98617/m.178072 type:complete len:506 (+) Transcript_98617:51-1568(+)